MRDREKKEYRKTETEKKEITKQTGRWRNNKEIQEKTILKDKGDTG